MDEDKKTEKSAYGCPVRTLFRDLEEIFGKKSPFFGHLTGARIEFLKGVRTFVDKRIEELEKEEPGDGGKRITRIKVEDEGE
ncbi:MAG: hypothetical protein WAL98_18495 [Desulfatiglandaceae bacterium]|jgi:hypothetical protein